MPKKLLEELKALSPEDQAETLRTLEKLLRMKAAQSSQKLLPAGAKIRSVTLPPKK